MFQGDLFGSHYRSDNLIHFHIDISNIINTLAVKVKLRLAIALANSSEWSLS